MEGATGDDWQETGFFVFGEKLVVHLSHLITVRTLVQSGTPISNSWQSILAPFANDMQWMKGCPLVNR